jgi:hypothetical protein
MRSGLVVGIELYVVVLRLFSNLGGPLYIAVTGEPTQAGPAPSGGSPVRSRLAAGGASPLRTRLGNDNFRTPRN